MQAPRVPASPRPPVRPSPVPTVLLFLSCGHWQATHYVPIGRLTFCTRCKRNMNVAGVIL
jgi:hypothetical protein